MNAHLLSLASGVLPEFGPVDTADAAIAAGFEAAGLWVEPGNWTPATTSALRKRIADSGLAILDVEVIWLKPGPLDPAHRKLIDIGAEVGARNALVVSSDPDDAATTDKLGQLCLHAAGAGMRIALEFGYFTEVQSMGQARAIVEGTGHPAAALLIDPLHLARTGGSPEDVAAVPRDLLPYAQICDAPASGPEANDPDGIIREAVDERLQTGDGALPLRALLKAMPPAIPLSIELRSRKLREGWPDPAERARVTLEATRRFLNGAS